MLTTMRSYLKEKGQGIVEYAVLLAFVVAVAAYVFSGDSSLKSEISNTFSRTTSTLSTVSNQQ